MLLYKTEQIRLNKMRKRIKVKKAYSEKLMNVIKNTNKEK